MKVQMIGCSHHNSSVETRERLAFDRQQSRRALAQLRQRFPESEAVLLSTCNRVELYTAADTPKGVPSHHDIVEFLAPYVDAGAQTLNLTPCGPDRASELEVMAEVAGRLRAR